MIDTQKIAELRNKTGLSVMMCKKALEESGGDENRALGWLRERGIEMAEKKSARETKAGIIEAYIHSTGRIGAMLELRSETDFVAKNPGFKELAHNLAMHIAACNPPDVALLLEQPYIKNLELTTADYINEAAHKFGEKIEITRFERFEV